MSALITLILEDGPSRMQFFPGGDGMPATSVIHLAAGLASSSLHIKTRAQAEELIRVATEARDVLPDTAGGQP